MKDAEGRYIWIERLGFLTDGVRHVWNSNNDGNAATSPPSASIQQPPPPKPTI